MKLLAMKKILFALYTVLNKTLKVGFDDVAKMAFSCQKQLNQEANINLGILQLTLIKKDQGHG